jgi:hypothetical protein
MSRVKVNEITNKVATGPVDFPDGITGVALTVTGNVTVGGTIISEDTTNVDSVGFITARAGLNVGPPATGIGATIHSNGNAVFAGIATVGAGFSVSSGNFTVQGGSAAKPTFQHSAGWGALRVAGSAGGSGSGIILANNYSGTVEEKYSIYLDGSTDALRFTAGPPENTSDEKVRITAAGRVVIGDTASDAQLGVVRDSYYLAEFTNTNADATGAELSLRKDSASPADNDSLGILNFIGDNDAGQKTTYTYIRSKSTDVTDGTEDGTLEFHTRGNGTITERLRITGAGGFNFSNGELIENCNVTAGKLSDNLTINLDNGMVHLFTTAESTTAVPNIMSTAGINTSMSNGDAITVTLITTANAAAYCDNIQIDGAAVTENWIGGSAPSDGGSSGVDVHTFTIIKTASATFTVLGNQSKTS